MAGEESLGGFPQAAVNNFARAGESAWPVLDGGGVWFSPGVRHWHGAAPTTAMTHIAIQETENGKMVDWMEKVSDDQYRW